MVLTKLKIHPVFQNLITNGMLVASGMCSSIILARLLGPEGNGVYRMVLLWPMMIVALGGLGIEKAVSYYSGKERDNSGKYYLTALTMLAIWAVPLFTIFYICIPWLIYHQSISAVKMIRIGLFLIFIQFIGNLPFWILHGMGQFRIWNIVRLIYSMVWLTIITCGAILKLGDPKIYLISYLIVMIVFDVCWTKILLSFIAKPIKFEPEYIIKLLKYGLPTVLSNIPQQLSVRLDQLLMSSLTSASILGIYAVAVTWGEAVTPITNSIAQYAFPQVIKQKEKQIQYLSIGKYLTVSLIISCLLFVVVAVLSPIMLPFMYGKMFENAVRPAIIIAFANIFRQYSTVASESVKGLGKPAVPMIAEIIGLVISLLILLPTIRSTPLLGAAIASAIGYASVAIVLAVYLSFASQMAISQFTINSTVIKDMCKVVIKRLNII